MGDMRRHGDQPTLITTVPLSSDDELDKRKKKYAIMMGTRALCVILAASFYNVSIVLAVIFALAGVVLPWCAVLIANDGPVKRRKADLGHVTRPVDRALPPGGDDRTVDG
jgi:Flp pilus assembly protein TadB